MRVTEWLKDFSGKVGRIALELLVLEEDEGEDEVLERAYNQGYKEGYDEGFKKGCQEKREG